ncbi:UNKNOWN [Stylonychia lemnae]|uniref:Uncharacterized protein n=1 Tax=Stylonychia lemnae TaxID=5949 RepID=A0A078AX65_STYLE|nr:UNKNOWN [Stylonychia lemnae]|eukprot:CDW85842.1 UNKNOWN [Stylonychia lemnae]
MNTTYQSINLYNDFCQSNQQSDSNKNLDKLENSSFLRTQASQQKIKKLDIKNINKLRSVFSQQNLFVNQNQSQTARTIPHFQAIRNNSNDLINEQNENMDLQVKGIFAEKNDLNEQSLKQKSQSFKGFSTLYHSKDRKMEFPKKTFLRGLFQEDNYQQQKQESAIKVEGQAKITKNEILLSKLKNQMKQPRSVGLRMNVIQDQLDIVKAGQSFLDSMIKDGDCNPDILNSVSPYNMSIYDVEWKNAFKKLQKNHIPSMLPKLSSRQQGSSHYNLSSISSKRLDTEIQRDTEYIENLKDINCNTCMTKENFKERFRSLEPRTIEFTHEPLRTVDEQNIFKPARNSKKRIKYIEELLKKESQSPNGGKFNPYSERVKPLQVYPRLKQQITQMIDSQFSKTSDNFNESSEYYLSKRKFSKYLNIVQESNQKQLESSFLAQKEGINSVQNLSPLKKNSKGRKNYKFESKEEEDGSYQMLMRSKTQQLKTLFEQFRQINKQRN